MSTQTSVTTKAGVLPGAGPRNEAGSAWASFVGHLKGTTAEWRRRARSRRELALLSDVELRDMGYPAHFEAEKAKPFWRE